MKKRSKADLKKRTRKLKTGFLTDFDVTLLKTQIRKNSFVIDHYIRTIDLLVNKEQCPKDANTLLAFRKRLDVAICENDTFRKALWRHLKMVEQNEAAPPVNLDPIFFLVSRIKTRKFALIAQKAMAPHHK